MRRDRYHVAYGYRSRQQGVLVFITPMLLLLVLLFGTLTLDGARLYSLRSAMQSQVNAAATAAADATQACGGQSASLSNMKARALTAAKAQGFSGSDSDLSVQYGVLEDTDKNGELAFRPTDNVDESNAVRVAYKRQVRVSMLLPQSFLGGINLSANAAVRKEAVATISAAGSTANVDGGLLGGLLGAVLGGGNSYSLDPTSLNSLEKTTIKLGDLLNATGVNTVAGLLPLSGEQLADALSSIATNRGIAGVAGLLDNLATANGIDTIKVSDVIDVVGDASVPRNSQFPLYDTVISLVLNVAKSQSGADGLIDLPIKANILSLAKVDVKLHVGEPSKIVIGPARKNIQGEWMTQFEAPDIALQVTAEAGIDNILGIKIATLSVPIAVNAGVGKGALIAVDCARGTQNSAAVTMSLDRDVANVVTGIVLPSGALKKDNVNLKLLGAINIPLIPLDIEIPGVHEIKTLSDSETSKSRYSLYCTSSSGCDSLHYQDPGGGLDLDSLDVNASLAGLKLGKLLGPVTNLLKPILDGLVNVVINPLLKTLGVGLGGISVTVSNVDQSGIQLIENVPVASSGT